MNPYEHITTIIHQRLLADGFKKNTLDEVKDIIRERNFMMELYPEMGFIDWDRVDKKNRQELKFRKIWYETLKQYCECRDVNIDMDNADFERIFRLEDEIIPMYPVNYYEQIWYSERRKGPIPFLKMNFKMRFSFEKWTEWMKTIDTAIGKFYEQFEFLPNKLVANKFTHSQINFIINSKPGEKDDIFRYDNDIKFNIPVPDDEEIELAAYVSGDCKLHFWFDERLKNKKFILDYDDELNWDHDDDDDDDNDDDKTPIAPSTTPERTKVKV